MSSNEGPRALHHVADSEVTQTSPSPTYSKLKRKRRLSDADGQVVVKRPHNALCFPRIQTVSNPLPLPSSQLEHSSDELATRNTISELLSDAIPAPVSAENPSSPVLPLDIDPGLFNFSTYNLGEFAEEDSPDVLGRSSSIFS